MPRPVTMSPTSSTNKTTAVTPAAPPTIVAFRRSEPRCGRMIGWSAAGPAAPLRRLALRKTAGTGRGFLLGQPPHAPHERRQLPHLVVRDSPHERRHAVRPPLHDRRVDLLRPVAVEPLVVHQRRPYAPAAVGVATGAVVGVK